MADSSLDDFFAKKDKSKKKGKSKVTPNDLLEKQQKKKKKTTSEKKKEENPQQIDVDPAKLTGLNDDEEWLDVQEEEKDYSGLRIQNLQLAQEREESEKESEDKGSDEDEDESGEKKEGAAGPWGKIDTPAVPVVQKPSEPEPESKKDDTPARPAKYVPPGARQAAAAQSQLIGPGMGPRRGKRTAPNLQSEEDFPTLGCESQAIIDSAWGSGGKFEKVKGGVKQMDDPANKGPQLSLGNKYTALQGGTE